MFRAILHVLFPQDTDDPVAQMAWRRTIAAAIAIAYAAFVFSFAWAQGWFAPTLFGIATTDKVLANAIAIKNLGHTLQTVEATVQADQNDVKRLLLTRDLKSDLYDRCLAVQRGNAEALSAINRDIDQEEELYYEITGHGFNEEDCSVLLIEPHKDPNQP